MERKKILKIIYSFYPFSTLKFKASTLCSSNVWGWSSSTSQCLSIDYVMMMTALKFIKIPTSTYSQSVLCKSELDIHYFREFKFSC